MQLQLDMFMPVYKGQNKLGDCSYDYNTSDPHSTWISKAITTGHDYGIIYGAKQINCAHGFISRLTLTADV